jgi:hypothetical protein
MRRVRGILILGANGNGKVTNFELGVFTSGSTGGSAEVTNFELGVFPSGLTGGLVMRSYMVLKVPWISSAL